MANQHFQAQPIRDLICADFADPDTNSFQAYFFNFNTSDMDRMFNDRTFFDDLAGISNAGSLVIPDGGKPKNLVQGLTEQIARVTEIRTIYLGLPKDSGKIAAELMKQAIDTATDAQARGDVAMMISSFNELKEFQL